ncbi:RE1-silencing transcription factor [Drosophila serrata]|uniref:RE1-silencing transcription factor-like n=1 Tax=Drosophila serrata TaxID=7274 RepID=UPI000A1CFA08|nr:RE1-silencing transcription factor-like [Drosophila serrata]XP_020804472.1 RE1-silencing transcription factor-like [Drosophila serrata]XP_020804473.1 RE1-silencing transcription factor-like [Drosophila serrata]XP_020804487.1 RE1-silencing transcription factor [Drosophila serrata]XP_020804488.1 RE1-silencing transcription factor [Drosophila serrata]XP_020804489.1 RE1-silencing transcription factor [Drosophila serrata]
MMPSDNCDSEDECMEVNTIRILRCSVARCPYRTNRAHNLWRHEERHKRPVEPKPFGCPVCIYNTDKITNLKRHVAIRHPKEVVVPKTPDEPDTQLKSAAGTRRIRCQVMGCRYETNRAHDLKRHMAVHNNVEKSHKEYKCSLCMYSSDRKANLKRHLELRHSGIEETIQTADELEQELHSLEEEKRLEELAQQDELFNDLIENLDEVELEIERKETAEEQVLDQLAEEQEEEEPPLITISTCKPPMLQGDITDKQVIAVNVNGQLRWFQSIDPPPGASLKLQLALEEQEQQAASAQQQMDELDDELALSLAQQDQEEELLVEMLTKEEPSDNDVSWTFHISNDKLIVASRKCKQEMLEPCEELDFPIWWDDGDYTKMHKNQTFRDCQQKPSKAVVQRILRDIYDIYYKPFKEKRKQFQVFRIKDSWLCATQMTRMQIIKDMYSKQGT